LSFFNQIITFRQFSVQHMPRVMVTFPILHLHFLYRYLVADTLALPQQNTHATSPITTTEQLVPNQLQSPLLALTDPFLSNPSFFTGSYHTSSNRSINLHHYLYWYVIRSWFDFGGDLVQPSL